MPIRQYNMMNALAEGENQVIDQKFARNRNALAGLELENAPTQIAQRNTLGAQDIALGQQRISANTNAINQEIDAKSAEKIVASSQWVSQSQTPKAFAEQRFPQLVAQLQQQGVPWETLNDDEARQLAQEVGAQFAAQLGKGPAPQKAPEAYTLSEGQTRFVDGKPVASVAAKPPAPVKTNSFKTMTPQEIEAAGLPPGTSAQIDSEGKITVLSKRDSTANLSQRDQTTAKMKLNTVALARQQLNNIRARFEPLKGTLSGGPFGQGKVPTEKGRAFDQAVNQMRSTLTALTRVPGVGAMSIYETKLDQAKFPTRNEYESVTEQQINDLDNMLNAIETGYTDLLGGKQGGASGSWGQSGTVMKHPSGATVEFQ